MSRPRTGSWKTRGSRASTPRKIASSGVANAGISVDQIAAARDRPGHAVPVARAEDRAARRHALLRGRRRQPLPMEYNPRTVFYRLFGPGDTPAQRSAILDAQRQHPRSRAAGVGALPSEARRGRPHARRRLLGLRARGRAARAEHDRARTCRRSTSRARRSACPRTSTAHMELDVRSDRAGVPGESHARRDVPDGDGDQHARVHAGRRLRRRSIRCRTMPNDPSNLEKLVADPDVPLAPLRALRRAARRRTEDGDGSLLDHSIILFGSNMSNSDKHDSSPLPLALLGHGYGRIAGGQHVRVSGRFVLRQPARDAARPRRRARRAVGDSTGDFERSLRHARRS